MTRAGDSSAAAQGVRQTPSQVSLQIGFFSGLLQTFFPVTSSQVPPWRGFRHSSA